MISRINSECRHLDECTAVVDYWELRWFNTSLQIRRSRRDELIEEGKTVGWRDLFWRYWQSDLEMEQIETHRVWRCKTKPELTKIGEQSCQNFQQHSRETGTGKLMTSWETWKSLEKFVCFHIGANREKPSQETVLIGPPPTGYNFSWRVGLGKQLVVFCFLVMDGDGTWIEAAIGCGLKFLLFLFHKVWRLLY